MFSHFLFINTRQKMLITVQPDPNWQLSLAQLSPSLFNHMIKCNPKSVWPNMIDVIYCILLTVFLSIVPTRPADRVDRLPAEYCTYHQLLPDTEYRGSSPRSRTCSCGASHHSPVLKIQDGNTGYFICAATHWEPRHSPGQVHQTPL